VLFEVNWTLSLFPYARAGPILTSQWALVKLKNQHYFQLFSVCITTNITNSVKTTACGAAIFYVKTTVCGLAINSMKISLILQPAGSDVKIGPARVHGNRLLLLIYLGLQFKFLVKYR